MADQRLQTILDRKASALAVLGPIGFIDNEDDETPGTIFHSGCRITLDCAKLSPKDVVAAILEVGQERGKQELRNAMRNALGI